MQPIQQMALIRYPFRIRWFQLFYTFPGIRPCIDPKRHIRQLNQQHIHFHKYHIPMRDAMRIFYSMAFRPGKA